MADAISQEDVDRASRKAIDDGGSAPIYYVSYDRYRKLSYLTEEILKVDLSFVPVDPYAIEFKAQELGIRYEPEDGKED
jgi:hypothetical protein